MSFPDWDLQKAIYAALVAAEVCGGRVYDRISKDAAFPYVTIGDSQVLDDGALFDTCIGGWEAFHDIHIWSRPESGSKRELKEIAADVITSVAGITAVEGFVLVVAQVQSSRSFRDPDGMTEHGVLTFRFLIDETE